MQFLEMTRAIFLSLAALNFLNGDLQAIKMHNKKEKSSFQLTLSRSNSKLENMWNQMHSEKYTRSRQSQRRKKAPKSTFRDSLANLLKEIKVETLTKKVLHRKG